MNSMVNPMRLRHAKTLITGMPGVGKTTLVQKIIKQMAPVSAACFCTSEIRCRGSRLGFELQSLNGKGRTLAHVEIDSRHRVGRYGVDKDGFEEFLATLDLLNPDVELIVIDAIGKMELFSSRFRNLVCDALNADKQVLATIPLKGNEFIREIKQRLDVRLLEVTHANRDRLPEAIVEGL
jgi:nucleoside-triphosphatase